MRSDWSVYTVRLGLKQNKNKENRKVCRLTGSCCRKSVSPRPSFRNKHTSGQSSTAPVTPHNTVTSAMWFSLEPFESWIWDVLQSSAAATVNCQLDII